MPPIPPPAFSKKGREDLGVSCFCFKNRSIWKKKEEEGKRRERINSEKGEKKFIYVNR
jgi:hypothetical protein